MCGRFSASYPPNLVEETYAAVAVDDPPPPKWNVAPTDPVTIVVQREQREVRTVRWGLIPSWADDRRIASRLINARAETLAEKPAFRAALARRRCLVPADGWYEWRQKQPFFITRRGGGPVAFAGLYEVWRDPETDELVRTCAIVTTEACADLKELHTRMPVVLGADAWDEWLDREREDVLGLLVPCEGFDAWPVSPAVNNVRNDGPSLVEPLPALF